MKEGWEEVSLEEYINLIDYRGRTPVKTESGVRLITAKNVKLGYLQEKPEEFIDSEDYDSWMTRGIPNFGDVIFTTEAPLGNVAQINTEERLAFAQRIIVMQPLTDKIDQTFLKYMLLSPEIRQRILEKGTGATVTGIKSKLLKKIPIPIPPLPEQKKIVAILDEAFAAIDEAKANIEKNIKNAGELFQSRLNEIFSQKGEGWEEKKLGEVCIVERGSSPRPIKKYLTNSKDGVNWIKIGDVNENEKYVQKTQQKITKEGAKKSRFVNLGDFILSNSMSFGRPYIMKISGYIHDGWFVLRLPAELNSDYFWQLLSSPYLKQQFENLAAGAIVKNISGDLVKKALIPIPSLEEQMIIVNKTEILNSISSDIQKNYNQKLSNLEELKKSLLQKAFAGELT